MKCIAKYPLGFAQTIITLPALSQVLSVGAQNNHLYLWVVVDDSMPNTTDSFLTAPANDTVDLTAWRFIGSVGIRNDTEFYNIYRMRADLNETANALETYFWSQMAKDGGQA